MKQQRWELVNIFVYHKHDIFLMIVVVCSNGRKQNDTLIYTCYEFPLSVAEILKDQICVIRNQTLTLHFSIIISWTWDEGSLLCDNQINDPVLTGKWVLSPDDFLL